MNIYRGGRLEYILSKLGTVWNRCRKNLEILLADRNSAPVEQIGGIEDGKLTHIDYVLCVVQLPTADLIMS